MTAFNPRLCMDDRCGPCGQATLTLNIQSSIKFSDFLADYKRNGNLTGARYNDFSHSRMSCFHREEVREIVSFAYDVRS